MAVSGTPAEDNLEAHLKLALALAIVESKRRRKLPDSLATASLNDVLSQSRTISTSDALKWKTKAKQRKEEILRLTEELKKAEEGMHQDMYPPTPACKCYFYSNMGSLPPVPGFEPKTYNDVLRRRFLRQVRLSESRKRSYAGSSDIIAKEDELELLRSSVDFLVDLCEQSSSLKEEKGNFKSMSHQAADFILATLKALPLDRMRSETTESIVGSLIMRLMRSMCNGTQEVLPCPNTFQLCVQHLMRNLGSNPVIGQCIILSASHRISMTAESLLSLDPFECRFSKSHQCLFLMVQLIEFVISDYLLSWPTSVQFDSNVVEEWVASVFSARKSLEALENMNTLYVLYMDQVVGELTRNLSQPPFLQVLGSDFVAKIFTS